jgi:uncharacterized membrane protein YjjP (DUF1212 family)
MSQISPKSTANRLPSPLPSEKSLPDDTDRSGNNCQKLTSRRVLDNSSDFTYDLDEQSRGRLDSWPEQVEIKPRRRSTLLSSLIRGNQPRRSFFGGDNGNDVDDSEPIAAAENNRAFNPLGNARKLSVTAMSALKEKVPHPAIPWKQKGSPSQSANSRARTYAFPCDYLLALLRTPTHLLPNAALDHRKKFILLLAKAFLTFGAPSHRVETQLFASAEKLLIQASFAYIPGIIMVSFNDGETRTTELHFVRSSGRIALSALNNVHDVYRDVFDDRVAVQDGISALDRILRAPPLYPLIVRCGLAFVCASVICPLAFGGSFIDMWVSGTCACVLQFLGLQAAAKSSVYANVYEYVCVLTSCDFSCQLIMTCACARISVSIIVSFVARSLSSIPGRLFCYSSISSAGVVLILPGFTICEPLS